MEKVAGIAMEKDPQHISSEEALPPQRHSTKLVTVCLISLICLIGITYGVIKLRNRTDVSDKVVSKTDYLLSRTPTPNTALLTEKPNEAGSNTRVFVDPPEKYGFTESITLEGIGVRAQFPPNATVSLEEVNMYVVSVSESDQVTLALKSYDGGGRRAWFQDEYPWASEYLTEPFVGEGHSGYISYAVQEKDLPGPFFYFAVIGDRMLVVSGNNYISNNLNPTAGNNSVFFTTDIQKFKSFLSGIEVIAPKATELETFPKMSDLFRWSDTRKTIWDNSTLGLKITAPEWTESRFTRGRDADGKFIYTEWTRAYPKAQTDSIPYLSDTVSRTQVTGGYMSSQFLTQLPARFQGKTFAEVADEALIAGGFCATGWKNSRDECENLTNYCYTRNEVVQHLTMKKEFQIGSHDVQLRSMDRDFSNTNDCRSEDVWLVRAANGQYVTSEISPDADTMRLEAL